jgi:hypothetical protein
LEIVWEHSGTDGSYQLRDYECLIDGGPVVVASLGSDLDLGLRMDLMQLLEDHLRYQAYRKFSGINFVTPEYNQDRLKVTNRCVNCRNPIKKNQAHLSSYCGSLHVSCLVGHQEWCKPCRAIIPKPGQQAKVSANAPRLEFTNGWPKELINPSITPEDHAKALMTRSVISLVAFRQIVRKKSFPNPAAGDVLSWLWSQFQYEKRNNPEPQVYSTDPLTYRQWWFDYTYPELTRDLGYSQTVIASIIKQLIKAEFILKKQAGERNQSWFYVLEDNIHAAVLEYARQDIADAEAANRNRDRLPQSIVDRINAEAAQAKAPRKE